MPIEDVDFLGDNSVVDSTLFFLDSDSRDRASHPTPAEYVVQFSEPIKLVVGVDILDATIPAAMYVVDWNTDTFSVCVLRAPSDAGAGVEACAMFSLLLEANETVASAVSSVTVQIVECHLVSYAMTDAGINGWLTGGRATGLQDSSMFLVVVQQTGIAYPFADRASMQQHVLSSPLVSIVLSLRKALLTLQHGNYDTSSLMTQVASCLQSVASPDPTKMDHLFSGFNVASSSSGAVTLQSRYAFTNTLAPFVLDMHPTISTAAEVVGFDTLPVGQPSGVGYRRVASLPMAFGSVPASTIGAATLSNPTYSSSYTHSVVAPGIANLLGVRYITLRCPEIEQHLYSGMTYGSHSTGLGVFKLPAGSQVSNLRFDFISQVRKPFHPIGRLSRMTLRFELSDGTLYDFKGINTQVLLAVKFLTPGKRTPLARSVLNPDYDPDFLRYTTRAMDGTVESEEPSGLLPTVPPYEDGDQDESGGKSDQVAEAEAVATTLCRRREIAKRLLISQDKYEYPAPSEDATSWRAVIG